MTDLDLYQPSRTAVAETDTDSWTLVAGDVFELAERIANTEFVPRGLRGKPPAVVAAILYGREVGLPPMTALTSTHVIEGTPSISAEAMRALVFAAGHEISVRESSTARCRLAGRRRGSDEWTTVTWTIDDARRAGLLKRGSGWEKYPRAMLKARATAELCRDVFPDVIHGFRAIEEVSENPDDMRADEADSGPVTNTVQRKRRPRTAKVTPGESVAVSDESFVASEAAEDDGPTGYDVMPKPTVLAPPMGTVDTELPDVIDLPAEDEVDPDNDPVVEVVGPVEVVPAASEAPAGVPDTTRSAMRGMLARFTELGLTDRGERLYVTSVLVGRQLTSANDMTRDEISGVWDTLNMCETRTDLDRVVRTTEEYAARRRETELADEDDVLTRDQLSIDDMDGDPEDGP